LAGGRGKFSERRQLACKSIAENAGIKCPSFVGHILVCSLPILLPVLILVWAVFLRTHG
jgi:hypothetical protein